MRVGSAVPGRGERTHEVARGFVVGFFLERHVEIGCRAYANLSRVKKKRLAKDLAFGLAVRPR